MMEVELKYAVADLKSLRARLDRLGGKDVGSVQQVDRYFNHPLRDFASTGEALRIRCVGAEALVTYKGARLPGAVKARRELEWSLGEEDRDGARWGELLQILGFRAVATVTKVRQTVRLVWQSIDVSVGLDRVERLGTYVELESMSPIEEVERVRSALLGLAERLGLEGAESRSYLRLLLGQEGSSSG
jgi:adenylate cyclase, class 2